MSSIYTVVKQCAKFILSNILLGPRIKWGNKLVTLKKGLMYVNIEDNRGKKLINNFGIIDWVSVYIWNELSQIMNADVYVDIGANYGEICLSKKYTRNEIIYAFEPNEEVFEYLRRSVNTRNDKDNIKLKNEFVGIKDEKINFVIDKKWSGTSSGVSEVKDNDYKGRGKMEKRKTQKTSVDLSSIVNKGSDAIIKIDVEGAEKKVLEGNIEYISSFENIVVIMEYNSETSNSNDRRDISSLTKCMSSYRINDEGEVVKVNLDRYRRNENGYFKEEILLSRGDKAEEALGKLKVPKWFFRMTP